jgi:hypothetical protein
LVFYFSSTSKVMKTAASQCQNRNTFYPDGDLNPRSYNPESFCCPSGRQSSRRRRRGRRGRLHRRRRGQAHQKRSGKAKLFSDRWSGAKFTAVTRRISCFRQNYRNTQKKKKNIFDLSYWPISILLSNQCFVGYNLMLAAGCQVC